MVTPQSELETLIFTFIISVIQFSVFYTCPCSNSCLSYFIGPVWIWHLLVILNISQHRVEIYFSMNFFLKLFRVPQYFVAIDWYLLEFLFFLFLFCFCFVFFFFVRVNVQNQKIHPREWWIWILYYYNEYKRFLLLFCFVFFFGCFLLWFLLLLWPDIIHKISS